MTPDTLIALETLVGLWDHGHLRQTVRNALDELVRVGFLGDFLIEDDIISVERNLDPILPVNGPILE